MARPKTVAFDDLAPLVAKVRDFIERNAQASAQTQAGKTSAFWGEIFQGRHNYPDLNELMVCRRAGNTSGIDTDSLASVAEEKAYADQIHHLYRRIVPRDYAASLPETTFGAPYVFEHDGLVRSAAFWLQCSTSQRVLEFLKRYGPTRRLRVLEIGAGMGMCAQHLHLKREVESYTIVDLPENIYVSSLALSTSLTERNAEFHDVAGPPITEFASDGIHFCLPGTIERIGAKFDLIVNSFSLQEMAIENVNAYIDWAETVLSDEGIFVSFNSHAKAGVKQPSDYRYKKFHIHHWGVFRQTPPGWFNTIPYEVVLGRRRSDTPAYHDEMQNAVGWLMQLGLDGDLARLCEGLAKGALTPDETALLQRYQAFFDAPDDQAREAALQKAAALDRSAAHPFVKAHYHLVRDEWEPCARLLREALDRGLCDFARLRAGVLLATLARRTGGKDPVQSIEGLDLAQAYPDAQAIVQKGDIETLAGHAAHILRRPYTRPLIRRFARSLSRPGR